MGSTVAFSNFQGQISIISSFYFYQIGAAMLFDCINGGVPTHDYDGFTVCGKNKVSFDFEYQDICGFLCYIYMPSVLSVKKLL